MSLSGKPRGPGSRHRELYWLLCGPIVPGSSAFRCPFSRIPFGRCAPRNLQPPIGIELNRHAPVFQKLHGPRMFGGIDAGPVVLTAPVAGVDVPSRDIVAVVNIAPKLKPSLTHKALVED